MKARLIALALIAGVSPAFADGPFDGFAGKRSGSGNLTPVSTGTTERTRCQQTGTPDGNELELVLRCSSANAPIDLSCSLSARGQSVSGSCYDGASGFSIRFNGRLVGDAISGTGRTPVSSAQITFRPSGITMASSNARRIRNLNVVF